MASLAAIGFTLAGGSCCFGVSLALFGCALSRRNTFIASRCEARPRNVIYNPNPKHPCQDRGNPTFGWIPWVMRLTYDTMLKGVPGTGTRDGGLSGQLLKVNLDGIVLLRFHHLCLKICALAMSLYLIVVLPLYATARCSRFGGFYYNKEDILVDNTEPKCSKAFNVTEYQQLTLANIPTLTQVKVPENTGDLLLNFVLPNHNGLLARLYMIVFCAWIVTWYAMRGLAKEWVDVLALRRVYYLEADLWSDRNEELQETLLRDEREKSLPNSYHTLQQQQQQQQHKSQPPQDRNHNVYDDYQNHEHEHQHDHNLMSPLTPADDHTSRHKWWNHNPTTATANKRETGEEKEEEEEEEEADESYMTRREPWIPHPEQRDTVPNIELYSVLVGGLPSLPTEAVDKEDIEAVFSRKQSIDWQLSVTTAFFDHCVPNQPGFSSSVAAVTILPAASHITAAWNKWYRAAGRLRRLRFIRREIAYRRRYEIEIDDDDDDEYDDEYDDDDDNNASPQDNPNNDNDDDNDDDDDKEGANQEYDVEQPTQPQQQRLPPPIHVPQIHQPSLLPTKRNYHASKGHHRKKITTVYTKSEQKDLYYQEVLGATDDLEVESNLLHALNFGPEQTAVYSREFAMGGSRCAPNGCFEGQIRRASIDELLIMEKVAVRRVHEANKALRKAQELIVENDLVGGKNGMSGEELEIIMQSASAQGMNASATGGLAGLTEAFGQTSSKKASTSSNNNNKMLGSASGSGSFVDESIVSDFDSDAYYEDSDYGIDVETGNSSALTNKISTPEKKSHKQPASVTAAQLPGSLGLEAGLWMEQRNKAVADSNKTPPRKTNSSPDLTKLDPESQSSVSDHQTGDRQLQKPTHQRAKSSDAIDFLSLSSRESPPKRMRQVSSPPDVPEGVPFKGMQISLRGSKAGYTVSNEKENQRDISFSSSEDVGQMPESPGSILSILEKEEERKGKLREFQLQLSMQNPGLFSSPEEGVARELTSDSTKGNELELNDPRWKAKQDRSSVMPFNQESRRKSFEGFDEHRRHSGGSFSYQRKRKNSDGSLTFRKNSDRTMPYQKYPDFDVRRPRAHTMSSINEKALYEGEDSRDAIKFNSDRWAGLDLDGNASLSSHTAVEDNLRVSYSFETVAGLRQRDEEMGPRRRLNSTSSDKWSKVLSIVHETSQEKGHVEKTKEPMVGNGRWRPLNIKEMIRNLSKHFCELLSRVDSKKSELVESLASDSTYAVVTFTSRQAAVAARHCLADSRGEDRWVTRSEIPSPPLADAPVCNTTSCRGCVRPVTLSISDRQKLLRHNIALAMLATIYFFYTIPLTIVQGWVSTENLRNIFPDIEEWQEDSLLLNNIFSGFIPALVWTVFFAICPPLFKIIANFGSNATSSVTAENSALNYFWWFMFLTAFTGASLSTAVISGFNEGIRIGAEFQTVIESTAATIPTQVSATWLNWMIVRVTVVLPTQYLLQMNSFIFSWIGLPCCSRAVRGGGAGSPVPYRIYVDSGVVMLCLFALAPASPLIAVAAFAYFLFCTPLLRWTMIFLYKPKFDIGGQRFPFLFDICVSGIVVGQVLQITMMSLKRAVGPAFMAFLPIIPTILYRYTLRKRYLRAFSDVALLQTSLLDGWDTNEETSEAKREEFRRFLVDCHKAAYVPVCIASSDDRSTITAEPAVVVPLNDDEETETESIYGETFFNRPRKDSISSILSFRRLSGAHQPGQMLRRSMHRTPSFRNADIDCDVSLSSSAQPMDLMSQRYSISTPSPGHTVRRRVVNTPKQSSI